MSEFTPSQLIARADIDDAYDKLHAENERLKLAAPVEGLEGSFPVVLYFGNDNDREEFIAIIQEAKPGMVALKI